MRRWMTGVVLATLGIVAAGPLAVAQVTAATSPQEQRLQIQAPPQAAPPTPSGQPPQQSTPRQPDSRSGPAQSEMPAANPRSHCERERPNS